MQLSNEESKKDDLRITKLYDHLGESCLYRNKEGDCTLAKQYFEKIITATENKKGKSFVLQEAEARIHLAESYLTCGMYESALEQLRHALAKLTQHFGNNHPEVMTVKNRMSEAHIRRNQEEDYTTAARLSEEVLVQATQNPEAYHRKIADAQHNLGALHTEQGRHAEGIRCCRQALTMRQEKAGNAAAHERWALLNTLQHLSIALERNGNRKEAIVSLREALSLSLVLRPDSPANDHMRRQLNLLEDPPSRLLAMVHWTVLAIALLDYCYRKYWR